MRRRAVNAYRFVILVAPNGIAFPVAPDLAPTPLLSRALGLLLVGLLLAAGACVSDAALYRVLGRALLVQPQVRAQALLLRKRAAGARRVRAGRRVHRANVVLERGPGREISWRGRGPGQARRVDAGVALVCRPQGDARIRGGAWCGGAIGGSHLRAL